MLKKDWYVWASLTFSFVLIVRGAFDLMCCNAQKMLKSGALYLLWWCWTIILFHHRHFILHNRFKMVTYNHIIY